jgi:hypothetical protein
MLLQLPAVACSVAAVCRLYAPPPVCHGCNAPHACVLTHNLPPQRCLPCVLTLPPSPVSHPPQGELTVLLREGRNLPVWGLPWQSNPWCRLVLGEQAVSSRRDNDTGQPGRHRSPVWNQEVQFLVEDPDKQVGAGWERVDQEREGGALACGVVQRGGWG